MGTNLKLSREEKIATLEARIANFKEALQDKNTFVYSLYQSNSPKKDAIRAWGEALEDLHNLGVYKDEIWTISGYIRSELTQMGIPHARDWAKKVLPFKYKDSAKIHARNLLEYEFGTIRETQSPDRLNNDECLDAIKETMITEAKADLRLMEKFIVFLETHQLKSKPDLYELDEYYTQKRGTRKKAYESMDGRGKVITETFYLLMHAYTEATKSHAFATYMTHIKEILKLTPKQAVKLITGRVSKVDILYEPKNRTDAKMANFYGVACGECGSWRVDLRYHTDINKDMLFCYKCKNWNTLKTEKLVSKMI